MRSAFLYRPDVLDRLIRATIDRRLGSSLPLNLILGTEIVAASARRLRPELTMN